MKKVTKSVRVDPDLWHKARVKALEGHMTLEQLIEKLLTQYLKKKGG